VTFTARVIRGTSAFTEMRDRLDELLRAVEAPVTARVPWMEIWARHHEYDPLLIAVEDGGRLVAVAPFATRRRVGRTDIVGLGHGTSDRSRLPALDDKAAAALVDAVVEQSLTWKWPWRFVLSQLPAGDPVAHGLAARLRCAQIVPADPCPVLCINRGREADAYESKSMRKQVRQARNRMETDGRELAIDRRMERAAVEPALDELIEMHRTRDHALGRRSALDDKSERAFWRELVLDHAERGELEVVRMTLNGELAAYDVAFVDPPRYTVWDHRIGVEFGRYFPGHVLSRAQLDAVVGREEITILDHGQGDEPYKQLMSDARDECEELVAWSSPGARAVLDAPHRARQRAAAFADRHPPIRRAWVWLKQRTVAR